MKYFTIAVFSYLLITISGCGKLNNIENDNFSAKNEFNYSVSSELRGNNQTNNESLLSNNIWNVSTKKRFSQNYELKSSVGKLEGERCKIKISNHSFSKSKCKQGLICVPNKINTNMGVCRASCGVVKNDAYVKNNSACPTGRTCQIMSSPFLRSMGAFCLPVQNKRDGECMAYKDNNACSNNRQCLIAAMTPTKNGGRPAITSFKCRESCDYNKEFPHSSCKSQEDVCYLSPFDLEPQLDNNSTLTSCTQQKCDNGEEDCECDGQKGFSCVEAKKNGQSFCIRGSSLCGQSIPWLGVDDFINGMFVGKTCNQVDSHKFCDNSHVDTFSTKTAKADCLPLSESDHSGICIAFCEKPSFADTKESEVLECPQGYSCTATFGRNLGMVIPLKRDGSSETVKCDPSKCTANEPCPDECNNTKAECLTYPGKQSFCGLAYKSCQANST